MSAPVLALRGLTKAYRPGQPVLHGLNLDISEEGLVAIIGPSGTGKSTLIRCINRLVDMRLVATLRPAAHTPATEHRYQPARPLNRITLLEFKNLDDNLGDDPVGQSLERIDPILMEYERALGQLGEQDFFRKSLEDLLAEHPFDESRPPFAMGERTR